MTRLTSLTPDLAAENFRRLAALFPEAVTETVDEATGQVVRSIDPDALRSAVGVPVADERAERYRFTWPDKGKAIDLAFAPTSSVLRPVREKSVGRDGTLGSIDTENLYIEGDNLEALKILRETYLGRVKMIYIDPPYNTGHDFVYEDDFSQTAADYAATDGQHDESGNRLVQNTESNGRFHTDWLNMIYPRLRLAKDFLSDDGVIFISIDDNEVANLRKVCDEVFGAHNFVAQIVWQKIHSTKNDAQYLSENHEYVLLYAKAKDNLSVGLLPRTAEMNGRYTNPDNDPKGAWQSGDLVASGERSTGHYIITSPTTGKQFDVPQGKHWVYSEENLKELVESGGVYFGVDGNAFPRKKRYLSDVQDGRTANTLWLCDEVGHNQSAARETKALFNGEKCFDFPKPVALVTRALQLGSSSDSIILDFFSGSATTAHAVMQLNAEDGGTRKFIMVQLPEVCAEGSEAARAGYRTICDIGEERIRRAGRKILEAWESDSNRPEGSSDPDIGFRVYRVDSANMKDVRLAPNKTAQTQMELFADNVKEDRTAEDLLAQAMLALGVPLSKPITEETVEGRRVFSVDEGFLVACFERDVPESVVREIARWHPVYAVLRDASLGSDASMANFDQIFAAESPTTTRRVM